MRGISIRSRYSAILLCAAAGILVAGILLRPAKPTEPEQPSELEMARLRRLTEQRRLGDLSRFLGDAAAGAASRLLYRKQAPHTALVWDATRALGPVDAAPAQISGFGLRRVAAPAGAPFAVYAASSPFPVAAGVRAGAAAVNPGDWVIAVARNSGNRLIYAHGLYQGTSAASCGAFAYERIDASAAVSPALAGGGLFTLDGRLLGLVAACQDEIVVVSNAAIAAALERPVSIAEQLEQQYGMGIAETAERNRGEPAVRVVSVWKGGTADRVGVEVGDVVAEADDRPVRAEPDLESLAADAGRAAHTLGLRRGRKSIRVTLPGAAAPESPPVTVPSGMQLFAGGREGKVRVLSVTPGSAAARAGIRPGDVLMQVAKTALETPEQAADVLLKYATRPAVVTANRAGEQVEFLLAP